MASERLTGSHFSTQVPRMFEASPFALQGIATAVRGAGAAAWLGYYYFISARAETD